MTTYTVTAAEYAASPSKWFEFCAWNRQLAWGFGTKTEADTYCDLLNAGRDVNHYHAHEMSFEDSRGLDSGDDTDGFRLDIAIDTMRENSEARVHGALKEGVVL